MNRDEVIAAYESTLAEFEQASGAYLAALGPFDEYQRVEQLKMGPLYTAFVTEHKNAFWGETQTRFAFQGWAAEQETFVGIVRGIIPLTAEVNVKRHRLGIIEARMAFYAAQLK